MVMLGPWRDGMAAESSDGDGKGLSPATRLAIGSIVIGIAVLILKALAAWMTGSLAFFSDALESSVNVVAAIVALFAVSYGGRPADRDHPYGHAKAEYFAAVLEGLLIVCAAALIVYAAVPRLINPSIVALDWPALGISLLASLINFGWARRLIRRAAELRSPALSADGHHIMADVVSSVGAGAGVLLAMVTGWGILDPLLAIAVAGNVLWSGWRLIGASVGGLMDVAPSEAVTTAINAAILRSGDGALEAHDIRSRVAGANTFVEFHLVVPGSMTVSDAHVICDRIENEIRQRLGQATINIHVEPEEKQKKRDVILQRGEA
jgi:cation diffusion facilitator family transporter